MKQFLTYQGVAGLSSSPVNVGQNRREARRWSKITWPILWNNGKVRISKCMVERARKTLGCTFHSSHYCQLIHNVPKRRGCGILQVHHIWIILSWVTVDRNAHSQPFTVNCSVDFNYHSVSMFYDAFSIISCFTRTIENNTTARCACSTYTVSQSFILCWKGLWKK